LRGGSRRLEEVTVADFELVLEPPTSAGVARMLVTTPRGDVVPSRRPLRGATCAEVTDAAAVAIALTIGEPATPPSPAAPTSPAPPPAPKAGWTRL